MNKIKLLFCMAGIALFSLSCEDDTGTNPTPVNPCKPTNSKLVEIISPKAGDILTIGQSITVKFRFNSDSIRDGQIDVSTDNGQSWDITVSQLESFTANPNSSYKCDSLPWIVQVVDPTTFTSSSQSLMRFKLYSGTQEVITTTGYFTIKK